MSQGKKIELTPKQLAHLKARFKDTDNEFLAGELGISESSLHRFARKYGLTKTKAHCKRMQAEAAAEAKRSHLLNGTYPPKGFIIPGSEAHRFKPGHKERKSTKKRRIAKASETRRATIAAERARLKAGKPQRTKLKISADPEATLAKVKERHYLKKRGYILDEVTATAFFSEATQRSPRLEAKPRFYSFRPQ